MLQPQEVFHTNIKGLPEEANYFTEICYSDAHPYVEVKRTAKTVTLARVNVETDPDWIAKKQFYPGGFFGHTPNQHDQTWLFKSVGKPTVRVFKTKKGTWASKGVRFAEGRATEFYDYNF